MSTNAISIKPAIFSDSTANGWFAILDAQFKLANIISEETQFYHALSALPPDTVSRLTEAVLAGKQYSELKKCVLDLHERTKPELFDSLTSTTVLTGKPSTFLSVIQQTANKVGVGEDFVRHKFIQSLPSTISPVIAAQTTLDLTQLGKLADELVPLCNKINVVKSKNENNFQNNTFKNEHKTDYNKTDKFHQNIYNTSNHDNKYSRGLTPYNAGQKAKVCRAHIFFGPHARNCTAWCTWPDKKNCSIFSRLNSTNNSRSTSPVNKPAEN